MNQLDSKGAGISSVLSILDPASFPWDHMLSKEELSNEAQSFISLQLGLGKLWFNPFEQWNGEF